MTIKDLIKNFTDITKVEKVALAIIEKYAGGRAKAFIELRDEIMKL